MRWLFLHKQWRPKGFSQFKIIINVFVSSLRFIWIAMLWVYGHYNYFLFLQYGDRLLTLWTSDSDDWSLSPHCKGQVGKKLNYNVALHPSTYWNHCESNCQLILIDQIINALRYYTRCSQKSSHWFWFHILSNGNSNFFIIETIAWKFNKFNYEILQKYP